MIQLSGMFLGIADVSLNGENLTGFPTESSQTAVLIPGFAKGGWLFY